MDNIESCLLHNCKHDTQNPIQGGRSCRETLICQDSFGYSKSGNDKDIKQLVSSEFYEKQRSFRVIFGTSTSPRMNREDLFGSG